MRHCLARAGGLSFTTGRHCRPASGSHTGSHGIAYRSEVPHEPAEPSSAGDPSGHRKNSASPGGRSSGLSRRSPGFNRGNSVFSASVRSRSRNSSGTNAHLWRNRESGRPAPCGPGGRPGHGQEPRPDPHSLPSRRRCRREARRIFCPRRTLDQIEAPRPRGCSRQSPPFFLTLRAAGRASKLFLFFSRV